MFSFLCDYHSDYRASKEDYHWNEEGEVVFD